jgi:hypothetical protein
MSLDSRDKMLALDSAYQGGPYCEIGAKTGLAGYAALDWACQGGPFVSLAVEGAGMAYPDLKVGGSFRSVVGASLKVGGAWKAITTIQNKVGGAWKTS